MHFVVSFIALLYNIQGRFLSTTITSLFPSFNPRTKPETPHSRDTHTYKYTVRCVMFCVLFPFFGRATSYQNQGVRLGVHVLRRRRWAASSAVLRAVQPLGDHQTLVAARTRERRQGNNKETHSRVLRIPVVLVKPGEGKYPNSLRVRR